jgi:hypothetical protein
VVTGYYVRSPFESRAITKYNPPVPLFALLLLAQVPEKPPTYDIAWRPKVGHVVEYDLRARHEIEGHTVTGSVKLKGVVKAWSPTSGYALRAQSRDCVMTAEGKDYKEPDVDEMWLESSSDHDEDADKLGEFGSAVELLATKFSDAPRKVGEEWTMEADDEKQRYRLIGPDDVGSHKAVKVSMASKSKDGQTNATYWFRKVDGQMLRAEVHVVGKFEDDDGDSHSHDSTLNIDLISESDEPPVKGGERELKLLEEVSRLLQKKPFELNEKQIDVANYDVTYEEDRLTRHVRLAAKADVEGMKCEKYPQGPILRYRFKKKGDGFDSAQVEKEAEPKEVASARRDRFGSPS